MSKRSKTKAERRHLSLVASMGCVVCRNLGYGPSPAEIHHPRAGQGMGQRAADTDGLPLCAPHHRTGGYGVAFHAGQRVWEQQFGTEAELLQQTRHDLALLEQSFA